MGQGIHSSASSRLLARARFSIIAVVSTAITHLSAQVQMSWSVRYNGPTNGWESALAVAIDTSGNIYVTGASESAPGNLDYLTAKYSPTSNSLWTARYNGPANGNDVPAGIKVDGAGNAYVTGTSRGVSSGDDIATVKYDSNGSPLWTVRYTTGANRNDAAAALEVDALGNVYVAGTARSNNAEFVTIKYDVNTNELWRAFYTSTNAFTSEVASSLAVDSEGKVYVTGYSGDTYSTAYATVKYTTNGNRLWAARYSGTNSSLRYPAAIGVDSSGNVFVTGRTEENSFSGRYDYLTVKHDPNGFVLWSARYSGLGFGNDAARALAIDSGGNVYVTGVSAGVLADDCVTVKYGPDGSQQWTARYNGPADGPDAGAGIALDRAGNVYVTGASRGDGGSNEIATIKYASNGIQLWAIRSPAVASTNLASRPIAVGSANEVCVVGEMPGLTASKDFALFKYEQLDAAGYPEITMQPQPLSVVRGSNATFTVGASGADPLTFQWRVNGRVRPGATSATLVLTNVQPAYQAEYTVQVSNALGWVESTAVQLTVNYITNQPQSQSVVQGADAYFKVQASGTGPFSYQWQFNGADIPGATTNLFVRTNAQPYDAGHYTAIVSNSVGVMGSAVARLSVITQVRQIWADARDPGHSLALDSAGNVYVTGSKGWLDSSSDCISAKFAPDGTRIWRSQYNGPGNGFDGLQTAWTFRGRLIAADDAGNAYVSACSQGTSSPGDQDFVTIKYDATGNPVWLARLDGNQGTGSAYPISMALDASGNVYVTGGAGSYSGDGYLTVKYDNDGNPVWTNRYTPANFATDLTLDGAGNVYITGRNFVTLKYDAAGNQSWVASYGDYAWAIVLDSLTNVIIAGSAYRSGTDYDYMTAKFDGAGTFLWSRRYPDGGLSWESAWDVAVGPADTIYVAGSAGTVKYTPEGVRLWFSDTGGRNVKVDGKGEAYLLDAASASVTGNDYSLRKLILRACLETTKA